MQFVAHITTSAHQEMRDSEREPFYDDIAQVIQNTKKRIPSVEFKPEILAVHYYGRVLT